MGESNNIVGDCVSAVASMVIGRTAPLAQPTAKWRVSALTGQIVRLVDGLPDRDRHAVSRTTMPKWPRLLIIAVSRGEPLLRAQSRRGAQLAVPAAGGSVGPDAEAGESVTVDRTRPRPAGRNS